MEGSWRKSCVPPPQRGSTFPGVLLLSDQGLRKQSGRPKVDSYVEFGLSGKDEEWTPAA